VTHRDHTVRFAILGDRTGGAQPGIYERIVQQVERLQPEFVITVGDMIEGPAPDRQETDRRWVAYKGLMDLLSAPVHYTPGNNDIWDDMSLKAYREHVGEPFYSFSYDGYHVVVLDNSRTEYAEGLSAEQLSWLGEDLRAHHDARQTLVFYHKPFWFETTAEDRPDTLHHLFTSSGVDAVFSGHYHMYFTGTYDGVRYTNVGSSGGYCTAGPTGLSFHFVWVTMGPDTLHIAPVILDAVLPWDEITASELKRIDQIEREGLTCLNPARVGDDLSVLEQTIEVTIVSPPERGSFLSDTLTWQVPAGWTVEPKAALAQLSEGERQTIQFQVTSREQLYPVPMLTIDYPYGTGKTFQLEMPLAVARTAACTRATEAPVMDGLLSDAMWRNPVSRLFRYDGTSAATESTFFYFAYDEEHLYLAARCMESHPESLVATTREWDGAVYGEDCVGYFVQPDPNTRAVYQIYVSALGTVFDQAFTADDDGDFTVNRGWNVSGRMVTRQDSTSWVMEMQIPVNQFGLSNKAGQRWRLNFRRKQWRLGEAADWQIPIGHNPSTFGFLDFR
jgi:predicted phosphodiesterase